MRPRKRPIHSRSVAEPSSGQRPPRRRTVPGQQPPGDQLGAAVMVGHVEGVEAGLGVGVEGVGAALGVQRLAALLQVRHLP